MALDRNQLKMQGLRYAKALQTMMKTVIMFSAEHPGAQHPIKHSYELLNQMLKQTRQFTIGFIDNRMMLNNVLTNVDSSLSVLENEFLKRGIGAVTFDAGITLAAYHKVATVLSVNTKHLDELGGLLPWVEQNKVEYFRVFPASKNTMRTATGDTVLEVDSEAFLLQKAMSEQQSAADPFEMLLQSHLSEMGIGAAAVVPGAAPRSGVITPGPATGTGQGPAAPGGGLGSGEGGGGFAAPPKQFTGNPTDMLAMVDDKFAKVLKDPKDEPAPIYFELAKMLRDLRPDAVISTLPEQRRQELMAMPRELMHMELFEDATLQWAVNRLTGALPGPESVIVEGEIIGILMKSLQATQNSVRLGRKLADLAKDKLLPRETYERIQEEMKWITLTNKQKFEAILAIEKYSPGQFKRLVDLVKEYIRLGKYAEVTQLANHYITFLQVHQMQPEDLTRLPELLRVLSGVESAFWGHVAEILTLELTRSAQGGLTHQQCVNGLSALTHTVAAYENFELVVRVGNAYETCLAQDPKGHADCCGYALSNIVADAAVDRTIELFLSHKDDLAMTKACANVLRWMGRSAIDKAFHHLEHEQNTAARLSLIRLISRLGPVAIQVASEMIHHPQWYVVRNGCRLLGEMKDPDLVQHVSPALRHADERVQQAAIKVLHDSRNPKRGAALADALPHLSSQLLEETLNELAFLKDPGSIDGVRDFIFHDSRTPAKVLMSAVSVLGNIKDDDQATEVLAAIVSDTELDPVVRRGALISISRRMNEVARRALSQFVKDGASHDALVTETLQTLKSTSAPGTLTKKTAPATGPKAEDLPEIDPV
jgi:HEAT repeat protein